MAMLWRFFRQYRWCILLLVSIYIGTSVWLMVSLQVLESSPQLLNMFERVFDPFGSIINRRCGLEHVPDFTRARMIRREDSFSQSDQCYMRKLREGEATIDMEAVWDSVSVSYPNLVLTVTGWVEPVQVKNWSAKPLHVIIVPHSHQDPGWLNTVDSYFTLKTRATLDLMVDRLTADPQLKFVWTEVVFLEKWWKQASSNKRERLKRLLSNGQLELLTGGWVMTDESVAHYGAMLDQLTEGHLWINHTLNTTVENGWAIDPFGHSSTMSYLLSRSGLQNNVIQRAHFAIKKHLAHTQSLEFYWKQHWDHHGNKKVLTHVMPFLLYGIAYSCGPDRTVCCKFDFYKKQCFHGNKHVEKITVDDGNRKQLATEFWEQLQKKSQLFRHNVLLVPHGDDFRYDKVEEWETQFDNLDKIMSYINTDPRLNMKIEYGTIRDYFTAVRSQTNSLQYTEYPTLSGDLYPYSDRGDQYWSGFYSVRPFYKYIVRKLQSYLRSAEILYTFSLSKLSVTTDMTALYSRLRSARRGLALFQHHDAITGTSRKDVMDDYGIRLNKAIHHTQAVHKGAIQRILQDKLQGSKNHQNMSNTIHLTMAEVFPGPDSLPQLNLLRVGSAPSTVVVSNTLGFGRQELVHVLVNMSSVVVMGTAGQVVQHQISPVWIETHKIDDHQYMTVKLLMKAPIEALSPGSVLFSGTTEVATTRLRLSFTVDIEPFSINTYTIQKTESSNEKRHVAKVLNSTSDTEIRQPRYSPPFVIESDTSSTLTFSNQFLTAHFTACDGMLKSVVYRGEDIVHKCDVHFVTYTTGERVHPFKDRSGAYTFVPDGSAKELPNARPAVVVVQGALYTQVRAIYADIVHTATIYNISGAQGRTVHLETAVNMNREHWDNRELVLRMETDVRDNQHTFCTDVNGFQLHRRKTRAKLSLQGNFYPMTTMAVLENQNTRFTVMSDSSHAVASIVSGWLEVVLDRRLMQDDWRGLSEDVSDNLPTQSSFSLFFEKKIVNKQYEVPRYKHLCFPSVLAEHLSEALNNRLLVLQTPASVPPGPGVSPLQVKLARPFPCDLHMVNFRLLSLKEQSRTKQALLVLHRKGLDCNVQSIKGRCSVKESLSMAELSTLMVTGVEETLLTGIRQNKQLSRTAKLILPVMTMNTFLISYT